MTRKQVTSQLNGKRRKRGSTFAWLACSLGLLAGFISPTSTFAQLTANEFRQIGEQGFGDRDNGYAWAICEYKGKIYFGSNRHFLCLSRTATGSTSTVAPEFPISCPDDTLNLDLRAKIWSLDPANGEIEMVFQSPTVEVVQSDGSRVHIARDMGYRTMAVFTDSNGEEAMYVGTFTSRKLPGPPARILRTTDGKNYTEIETQFSDNDGYNSYRSMLVFNNRLYVCVVGQSAADSVLLESSDPLSGDFRIVPLDGDTDLPNATPYSLAEFNGHLYVSVNIGGKTEGFKLLKTRAQGDLPYAIHTVLTDGAYRGPASESIVSMRAFGNWLYLGSGLFGGFRVLPTDVGAQGAELLRINANDEWELLVGEERDTPDGHRMPTTGYGAGFDNEFTGYIWSMVEHDGVFYIGTFDKSFAAQYGEGVTYDTTESSEYSEILAYLESAIDYGELPFDPENVNIDEMLDIITAVEGGFDVWYTVDGTTWERMTRSGFGNEFDYGVRNWLSTDHGLYLGTANPLFGFQVYLGQPTGTDLDGDSWWDIDDNCPLTWNLNQSDLDGDGIGDECDNDRDNDCVPNSLDSIPGMADETFPDTDGDGMADPCDNDDDGDTVLDHQDNCPLVANFEQADSDGDGIGNACESGVTVAPPSNSSGDNNQDTPANDDTADDETPSTAVPACGMGAALTLSFTLMGYMILGGARYRRRVIN